MTEIGIERPPGYSDEEWEAYQEGAQRMLELAGSFLLSMAGDVDGTGSPETVGAGVGNKSDAGDDATDPTDEDDAEDHPESCEDCGMDLVYELGRADGACPNCDLLD